MKKILSIAVLCFVALAINAVPAKRGWQTRTQADGTTIEIQQVGDEFYHYMINKDGKQVREINGMYVEVGEAPTPEVAKARRAKAVARRQRKDVGTTPNLAPKGVVILVNYSDKSMQSSHTQAVFDELCNSTSCTVNKYNGVKYGSAAQYFADQSNGSYRPVFDVFGPVTLSRNLDHYGHNIDAYGNLTDESSDDTEDKYATDAVIEACILANSKYDINFKDYDSDNDGYVDFVYVIYAGQGEADGGAANTIWPHNYSIQSLLYYAGRGQAFSEYSQSATLLDDVYLDNYAMSSELSGSALGGIGTLCHEFGHVIGLPDLYDTKYGTNYQNELTPNEWDIMDGGSYNGNGHCPPNYDPWEKYFFGWLDPVNPGSEPQYVTLNANGTSAYNVLQVNSSGNKQGATTSGVCYYAENRQQNGWDKFVPAHGMVVWKVNFDATAWTNNAPNNTANNPKFTIVCSSGTKVGESNGTGNVFGGSNTSKTEWKSISSKPIKNIKETSGVITAIYIEEPADPKYTVKWLVNGTQIEKQEYAIEGTDDLVLPTATVTPCEGTTFIGWTAETEWFNPFEDPADLFTTASGKVTADATYRAVFK